MDDANSVTTSTPSTGQVILSACTLVVVLAVIAVALSCNAPAKKRVRFEAVCQSFIVPASLTLTLNHGVTQIAAAEVYGFEGSVSGLVAVVDNLQKDRKPLRIGKIQLTAASNDLPPYLRVTPLGGIGAATVTVRQGVTLTGMSDGVLRVVSSDRDAVRLNVQSDRTDLDGQRYTIPQLGPTASHTKFSLTGIGNPPGLSTELHAIASQGTQIRADVTFANAAAEIPLLPPDDTLSVPPTTLRLISASAAHISIDQQGPVALVSDRALTIGFNAESGVVETLALVVTPKEKGDQSLRIAGWIDATSVRQGNSELLPTWIEETLATSNVKRGMWFIGLGFVAFVLFKASDRALDILLKRVLGE